MGSMGGGNIVERGVCTECIAVGIAWKETAAFFLLWCLEPVLSRKRMIWHFRLQVLCV